MPVAPSISFERRPPLFFDAEEVPRALVYVCLQVPPLLGRRGVPPRHGGRRPLAGQELGLVPSLPPLHLLLDVVLDGRHHLRAFVGVTVAVGDRRF